MSAIDNYMRTKYLIITLFVFSVLSAFSQNEQSIIGTWVVTGNNVYLYEFMDSGKLVISNSDGSSGLESKDNAWKITDDSMLYLTVDKGNSIEEYEYKLIEFTGSKMILNFDLYDHQMVFYKVLPNANKNLDLELNFEMNYDLLSDSNSSICKVKFNKNGACSLYDITLGGNTTEYNSHWIIFKREDILYLLIDDFEIFVVSDLDKNDGVIELVPYGFLKAQFEIENVKLIVKHENR